MTILTCIFIANQETIVELIGFAQRVMGPKTSKTQGDVDETRPEPAAAHASPPPDDAPKVQQRHLYYL